jgi:hypothetical protein
MFTLVQWPCLLLVALPHAYGKPALPLGRVPPAADMASDFVFADTDGDGSLSFSEWRAWEQLEACTRPGVQQACGATHKPAVMATGGGGSGDLQTTSVVYGETVTLAFRYGDDVHSLAVGSCQPWLDRGEGRDAYASCYTTVVNAASQAMRKHEASLPEAVYKGQTLQDDTVNQLFFKHRRGGVFVDIGANEGTSMSNSHFFEQQLGWHGLCVEPHSDLCAALPASRSCAVACACALEESKSVLFTQVGGWVGGLRSTPPPLSPSPSPFAASPLPLPPWPMPCRCHADAVAVADAVADAHPMPTRVG